MDAQAPLPAPQSNLPDGKQIVNGGIIFSLIICGAIIALGGWLTQFKLAVEPANDPLFYEWQLATKTSLGQLTAWLGFAVHQIVIWWTVWYATKHYTKYSDALRPANWWALGLNGVFIVLHYVQTAVFYDGLAQDVPSWTAQFAVALMLIWILAMETPRRGLFFGKKIKFRQAFIAGLKKYHGYFFSFAVIYTFWFHPMVPTWGHLVGFVHVILVMLQGSLMFTKVHLNRKWTFFLEVLVLPHSFQVALAQGNNLWGMFLYGFATIFIVTQLYGLNLKPWVIRSMTALYIVLVTLTYTIIRPPVAVNEVIRIPLIEYLIIFVMYGIFLFGGWVSSLFKGLRNPAAAAGD
jgi:hypothetical protein